MEIVDSTAGGHRYADDEEIAAAMAAAIADVDEREPAVAEPIAADDGGAVYDEDDEDKTAEAAAEMVAGAAARTMFPFGERIVSGGGSRGCVNLGEMRVYARREDGGTSWVGGENADRVATGDVAAMATASTSDDTVNNNNSAVVIAAHSRLDAILPPREMALASTSTATGPSQFVRNYSGTRNSVITPLRPTTSNQVVHMETIFTPSSSVTTRYTDWDMSLYENRLKTFRGWALNFITPREMARAGFYFTGRQDDVVCNFCSLKLSYWLKGEDPLKIHKAKSPDCHYVKQELVYDDCGIFENLRKRAIGIPGIEEKLIYDFIKTVGIAHQIRVLTHNKTFTAYDSRYVTFSNCITRINPSILTLCRAGFYYTGKNDETICFCCNQGLREWEKEDDPWVEHARWSPTCTFVLLSKGKHFVEAVGGEVDYNMDINMEELCQRVTVHKNVFIPDESPAHEVYEPIAPDRMHFSLNNIMMTDWTVKRMIPDSNPLITQQPPNTLSDIMLCKICFKEKLEVLFLPCGHIISCIQCAVTIEQCAICRVAFTMSLRVFIYPTSKPLYHHNDKVNYFPPDKPKEYICCKMCQNGEVKLVFLPCRHACTCFQCGNNMKECPVCYEKVYAFIKVFL